MRDLKIFFAGGIVAFICLFFVELFFNPEVEDLTPYTLERDSLYKEMNDSLELYARQIDSLMSAGLVHDTIEKKIYIRLQNDINQVNSINDSDSLVYLIKESIHARRTQTN